MLRQTVSKLTKSKTLAAAAIAGALGLMAMSGSAAQADPWHGNGHSNGRGYSHGSTWHNGYRGGTTVVVRNGYYYAPAPQVYVAPVPVYVAPPPPAVVYQPAPVYVTPTPLVSLQFRL